MIKTFTALGFLAAALVSTLAFADETAPLTWMGNVIEVHYLPGSIEIQQLQEYDHVVQTVESFLGPLKAPPRPILEVAAGALHPAANMGTKKIAIGPRYGVPLDNGQIFYFPFEYSDTILAHEFTHLIFDINFGARDPRWPAWIAKWGEIGPKLKAERANLAAIEAAVKSANSDAQSSDPQVASRARKTLTELAAKKVAIQARMDALNAEFRPFQEGVVSVSLPYNEFFADVAGVLFSETPDAITRAHDLPDSVEKYPYANHWRSFSQPFSIPQVGTEDFEDAIEPHNYFGQARYFVWKNYLANPAILKNAKPLVYNAVFEAIVSEIEWRLAQPPMDAAQNWQLLNDRLNAQIKLEMSRRGIEPQN